jgi:hypothetical protein
MLVQRKRTGVGFDPQTYGDFKNGVDNDREVIEDRETKSIYSSLAVIRQLEHKNAIKI